MIHFPDFRSYERAYQLITQVSGRAGRREKSGTVVVQTSNPEHPLLQTILHHSFSEFYKAEINDRYQHNYPPFARLIEIIIKHTDKKTCQLTADALVNELRVVLSDVRILGPGEPMISKIRNQFLLNILIKIPRGRPDLAALKQQLQIASQNLLKVKEHRNSRIIIDVDPV
jgi:primosomal protein N' (replication factor Y) (superfamily II helicase)